MKQKIFQYKYRILAIILWLMIWQGVSMYLGNEILLASPMEVMDAFSELFQSKTFYLSALHTIEKISLGFSLAVVGGILFALLANLHEFFCEFISIFIRVIKSIPVVSFIMLTLLWMESKNLSVIISFLMVLPVVYLNVLNGIHKTDPLLLEVAKVYRISAIKRIRYIYIPAVMPYFVSSCSIGLGLCWKSGIAAEVIGLPVNSIGEQLYEAKLYLMTKELFAWTIVIIIISLLFEKIVMMLIRCLSRLLTGTTIK